MRLLCALLTVLCLTAFIRAVEPPPTDNDPVSNVRIALALAHANSMVASKAADEMVTDPFTVKDVSPRKRGCDCGCAEGLPCSCDVCPDEVASNDYYRWRVDAATGQRWRYLRPGDYPQPIRHGYLLPVAQPTTFLPSFNTGFASTGGRGFTTVSRNCAGGG